ncbi:hypothetical protein ADUPG1_011263 [Aduncisulcus paluster]|uniref:Uncharacterized protein n=1 Tax=Aduncisulcus paluster TaxID=2918883 RepID=A0ABQ5JVC7_9EUKA|nr:hypothetical protein ADUPG1_011263 [Aduncisulcus paluster]
MSNSFVLGRPCFIELKAFTFVGGTRHRHGFFLSSLLPTFPPAKPGLSVSTTPLEEREPQRQPVVPEGRTQLLWSGIVAFTYGYLQYPVLSQSKDGFHSVCTGHTFISLPPSTPFTLSLSLVLYWIYALDLLLFFSCLLLIICKINIISRHSSMHSSLKPSKVRMGVLNV